MQGLNCALEMLDSSTPYIIHSYLSILHFLSYMFICFLLFELSIQQPPWRAELPTSSSVGVQRREGCECAHTHTARYARRVTCSG